jgi:2-polyprenyl-6-methoxyphenol hydroxylase-like FAD-dependent oxidoreductase
MQFCERQALLQILYNGIKSKSKVFTKKNVASIDHTSMGVLVQCDDGSTYQGSIIAGADGVNSKVREEMWRLAQPSLPDLVNKDQNCRNPVLYLLMMNRF